jgi:hypothetical protein
MVVSHCASVRSVPRSLMIVGVATPTTVPSTTMSDTPRLNTARPSQSRVATGDSAAGSVTCSVATSQPSFIESTISSRPVTARQLRSSA